MRSLPRFGARVPGKRARHRARATDCLRVSPPLWGPPPVDWHRLERWEQVAHWRGSPAARSAARTVSSLSQSPLVRSRSIKGRSSDSSARRLASVRTPTVPTTTSPSSAAWRRAARSSDRSASCFNEAAARRHGKPECRAARRRSESRASMRPRLVAAENCPAAAPHRAPLAMDRCERCRLRAASLARGRPCAQGRTSRHAVC